MKTSQVVLGQLYQTKVKGELRTVRVIRFAFKASIKDRDRFIVADPTGKELPKPRTAAALRPL